jgi:hypothetical protein
MILNRMPFSSLIMLAATSISILAGAAPLPVTVRDHFTNNSINQNLWDVHTLGGVSIAETNERLQFSANGSTGTLSYAGLEVQNWGAKWRYDFEIEIDYRLNLGNVTGNRQANVGIGLALTGQYPQNFTGFAAGVVRDDVGLLLGIGRYANGNLVAADTVAITATSGQITLEYDRSDDRLTARVGNKQVHLDGIWAQFGGAFGNQAMVVAIGSTTTGGNMTFPGTRVYIDEFQFEGVKKTR